MAPFFDELTASFAVADARPIALAMRPESNLLKKKVNEFLISRALTGTRDVTFTDDLEGLKKRRALRMITRNNSMTYFIYRGEQMGFDYELMKRFAEGQGLRLEVVIPPTHDDLLPWLLEGRGDVVAAAMAVTPERSRRAAFTRPYNLIEEVLVVRENAKGLSRPEDLAGKKVHVRKSSSFYRTLLDLKKRVPRLRIATVAEDLETEEILAGVEKGRWDITVCDSNLLKIERSYGRKLRAAFSLREGTLAWAVHPANKKLLAALNQFIKKEYKGLHYNLLKQKYFENKKTISQTHGAFRSDVAGRISPYDVPVKKYAAQYDLDWRLITSQMYQESRFDPKRKSWVGARGLMQIMPRTARELDVDDILDPEQNIRGGTLYLYRLLRRFDPKVPLEERLRFSLAAYNIGMGHVADARRFAAREGWSRDRWFGNVEKAMLFLEKPEYHKKARFGYCRGSESVRYVREIEARYKAYVNIVADNPEDLVPVATPAKE